MEDFRNAFNPALFERMATSSGGDVVSYDFGLANPVAALKGWLQRRRAPQYDVYDPTTPSGLTLQAREQGLSRDSRAHQQIPPSAGNIALSTLRQ